MKEVILCSPVRDRSWILDHYLKSVEEVARESGVAFSLLFAAHDCTDDTERDLLWGHNLAVNVIPCNFGTPPDERVAPRDKIYQALAFIRNLLIDQFLLTRASHMLVWDSDILASPNLLTTLLSRGKDVISAVVKGRRSPVATESINILRHLKSGWERWYDCPSDSCFEVDWTGALMLVKREVLEAGVRFSAVPQKQDGPLCGEDLGFCLEAKKRGFKIWADSSISTIHVMAQDQLPEALRTIESWKQEAECGIRG